jgi:hypothetical protein
MVIAAYRLRKLVVRAAGKSRQRAQQAETESQ